MTVGENLKRRSVSVLWYRPGLRSAYYMYGPEGDSVSIVSVSLSFQSPRFRRRGKA